MIRVDIREAFYNIDKTFFIINIKLLMLSPGHISILILIGTFFAGRDITKMRNILMNLKIKQTWGFLLLILVFLLYVVIFFLLNAPRKDDVTEIYFADRITAAHKILIDKYNRMHNGKVKVIPIDFPNFDFSTNERKEMLARSLRGRGEGIDVFAVDLIWVQRFAKWAEPLDKYFTEKEKKRIFKPALSSCYYEGEMVSAPLDMVEGVMYYREDLIKKLADGDRIIRKLNNNITWEEFLNIQNSFRDQNDSVYYVFPASANEGFVCIFMELLMSLREDYFEAEGFNLNTREAEKALQFLVDLINRYKTTPKVVTEFTEIPSYEYFINNNGVFLRGWNSYDKDFKESPFNPEIESHLRKAPIPYFKSGTPAAIFGGWNLMISKFSNKKPEAIDFIKFLLSDESQEIFYRESGYLPVVNSFYDSHVYLKKYPEIETLKNYMKSGVHRPAHMDYTRYSNIISSYLKRAVLNKISVRTALTECTNAIRNDKMVLKEYQR